MKTENICEDCPAGVACVGTIYLHIQQECKKGSYSRRGDLKCRKCTPGRHKCATDRMSSAQDCPAGEECDDPANPKKCEAGYKCLSRGEKVPCHKGTFSDQGILKATH